MNDTIGIAWFRDEPTYRRALAIFTDSANLPATYEQWKALVGKQLEEIRRVGNKALRADIDPRTFVEWCKGHGLEPNSQGRLAYVKHVELEYEKSGQGAFVEE